MSNVAVKEKEDVLAEEKKEETKVRKGKFRFYFVIKMGFPIAAGPPSSSRRTSTR